MNIEERLSKIERESRTWRLVALGLGLLIGLSLSCSQGTQGPTSPPTASALAQASQSGATLDTIRAKGLEIVNDKGELVASLCGYEEGASLSLHAPSLESRLRLNYSGVVLSRWPRAKKQLLQEMVRRGVRRGVTLTEEERTAILEEPQVRLGVSDSEGGGFVEVYNPFNKIAVSVQSNKRNEGMVSVHDVNGELSNALTASR